MNTKTSEVQRRNTRMQQRDKAIIPGPKYFIILVTTIILIFSFSVAFCAVFIKQLIDVNADVDVNDVDPPTNSVEGPINPTIPKRQSYISKTSSSSSNVGNQIRSSNVILVDLSTYESIAEKGADEIIYPASMTKVMSILVVCERARNLNKKLKVTKDIADYAARMGGSGFLSGKTNLDDQLTVRDLLYLTSYYSDTIAVIMLARHIAGSEEKFVKLMNDKAKSLGLKNTNFDNCTGLHSENNYSTCREIAAIMAYALDNSLCRQILTSTSVYKISTNSNNYTLWYPSWYGPDRFAQKNKLETVTVKGGKTGYIDESGVCLVSYAEGNGNLKRYIQVIVGLPKGSGLTEADSTREVKFVYNNYAT